MNGRVSIKHLEDTYGKIFTVLAAEKLRYELAALNAEEIAQLLIDLYTIPQPLLRPGEVDNLAGLLSSFARQRYGPLFTAVLAQQFGRTMAEVRPFDEACRQAEKSQANRPGNIGLHSRKIGYNVGVATSL